jgi:hypothetical protein
MGILKSYPKSRPVAAFFSVVPLALPELLRSRVPAQVENVEDN